MLTLHPQFITDSIGKKISAILPINEFSKLIEELEELEDIKLYDEAKKRKQTFADADVVFAQIEAKCKINV